MASSGDSLGHLFYFETRMHSLIGKVNRDPQFGQNADYRNFMDGRSDSALSSSSSNTNSPNSTSDPKKKVIVDLDLIVEKWIAFMWDVTRNKKDSLTLDDCDIEVNWARVDLTQEEPRFDRDDAQGADVTKSKVLDELFRAHKPKSQTLFRTCFTNNTDQEQEYSFKTERRTRQECCFSFNRGFARGKEGTIAFRVPKEILEIGGGIRSEQSVECGKDQVKEEEVSWAVDSLIRVQPHCRTVASLVINEVEIVRNFSIETRLRGRLTVKLFNRYDNKFVKSMSADIVEIIKQASEKYWIPASSRVFDIEKGSDGQDYAVSVIKGSVKFKLSVEQHVTLDEQKI